MQHLHDDYLLKTQKEPERSLFAVRICHYIGVKVPVVQWVESTTHWVTHNLVENSILTTFIHLLTSVNYHGKE